MSQVSYGTITIVDTTDIERIYMVYAKSVSNTTPPSNELIWSESIASAPGEGNFIWQKTVVEKAITEEKTYSDPVCVTGSSGQGVEKIINYYCNYGQGQPEEDYSGWQLEIPEYDSNKPNYWTKVVVIYSDDTREDFQASGTIATFESEKVGTFDSLEVSLSPIQDTSGGAPSPSNICPISGWDSVDVTRTGKNLLPSDAFSVDGYVKGDGSISAPSATNIEKATDFLEIVSGTDYIFSVKIANSDTKWIGIGIYDADKNFINRVGGTKGTAETTTQALSATDTENAKYVRISLRTFGLTIEDAQFELGTTATAYEPYQGQTHTTTLPQTVYGGTLDVVSGVLTVDRAMVDLGTLNWSTYNGKFTSVPNPEPLRKAFGEINMLCSIYKTGNYGSSASQGDGTIWLSASTSSNTLYVEDSRYSDPTAFKQAISGVQLVYDLATPTTITLTPTQIDSLIGRNNVWSDGTIEVEGHTISKRDVMIYKDNGLTDVVNKSAEANTNAAEALEKANDGIVSTTQLWYQTNSTGAPRVPTNHSQVDQGTITYNNWRSARPNNNVDSYKYYYYCYEYLHGDGTYSYSTEAILDTSNLSQYQIDQLQARIKKIWSNSTGSYMASGINTGTGTNEVDIDDSSTYGFNSKSTTTGVSFNYNTIPLTSLGTDGIKLYSPILTNGVITSSRLDAILDTNGLILNKGGIESGGSGNGYVYLSTLDKAGITINGHLPGTNDPKWRAIIGSKFGVDSEGNLYASNANISGAIDATSFIAKSYTGTTLNRQMSLGADGLKLMDGSGIILAQIDELASTIGKTSGAHSVIDADGQRFYASDGMTQLANIGYAPGAAQSGSATAPYYDFGTRTSGTTKGNYSVVEGVNATASGYVSHVEGRGCIASGQQAHAEGGSTEASGVMSHAEGVLTTASGMGSHAEGAGATASGSPSHAEGNNTVASGTNSHAEGDQTVASGLDSHAEGYYTVASGDESHASGRKTIAQRWCQTAIGMFNKADNVGSNSAAKGKYVFIIGNGTDDDDRSNALTIDWNGNISRYTEWDGSFDPSENISSIYKTEDTSGRWIGQLNCVVYGLSSDRTGQVGTIIGARHPSNPNTSNNIGIYIDANGVADYTVTYPAKFRSAIGIPYCITSEGSANGWAWRKFSDSTFEAWYSGTATTAITSAVGSLYQSGSNLTLTIPSGIGASSVLYGDVMMYSSSYGVWAYVLGMNSTTITYRGFSAISRASASYTVKAYIRGAYS